MRFEEVLPTLREGKKVRRSCWPSEWYMSFVKEPNDGKMLYACDNIDFNHYYAFSKKDFNADDWEIFKKKKKVKFRDLTKEQFKKYCKSITKAPIHGKGHICSTCPFQNVSCTDWREEGWIYHKDLYSDKFLDQEVEIEIEEEK